MFEKCAIEVMDLMQVCNNFTQRKLHVYARTLSEGQMIASTHGKWAVEIYLGSFR